MRELTKKVASFLPDTIQQALKRAQCKAQIQLGLFKSDEPEFDILHEYLRDGDWALDIGANIGHYTVRMSNYVGESGRVIAFEPIRENFAVLSSNLSLLKHQNVIAVNAAASDRVHVSNMNVPKFDSGLANRYMAEIIDAPLVPGQPAFTCLTVDSLFHFPRLDLVKIDVEGWEAHVIRGMVHTLEAWRPTMIIEDGSNSKEVQSLLGKMGYTSKKIAETSPNRLYQWKGAL